jgi:hypothetical protein
MMQFQIGSEFDKFYFNADAYQLISCTCITLNSNCVKNKKHNYLFAFFKKRKRGNFTYPMNFDHFCKYPSNVQNLSLKCIKVWFSLTLPFRTENFNGMSILPLTPKLKLRRFENNVVLELGIKLTFFVWNWQSERKPKFDIPK